MKEKRKQTGFTLIEVLIVVALIVVLVSMVLVATNKNWVDKEKQLTAATIEVLDTALQEYYDYTNDFPEPNSMEPFDAFDSIYSRRNASLYAQLNLVPDSKKILGRIEDSQTRLVGKDKLFSFKDHRLMSHDQQGYLLILDAWGMPFNYLYYNDKDGIYEAGENTFPVIISAGPDGKFDTVNDNINNTK